MFGNYTRSPEAKYPIALEEAYAVTKWIAENGQTLSKNSSRLAVSGDGVGGNMATSVVLLSKERGGPTIGFQLLSNRSQMPILIPTPILIPRWVFSHSRGHEIVLGKLSFK